MKKTLSIILCICLCIAMLPIGIFSFAQTSLSAETIDVIMNSTSLSYTFNDTLEASAAGTISFNFGNLPKSSVSSIKLYFTDDSGAPLEGYSFITEFTTEYKYALSNGSVVNGIDAADEGFILGQGTVIPYGAQGICAVLTLTVDGESIEKTVSNASYITVLNGVSAIDSTLPEFKKSTVDYTADINGEEQYQLFVMADFHNYYSWNPDKETDVSYNNLAYKYVSADGKSGSPQGKAMYAVKQILDSDEKSVGTITVGDIVDDSSDGKAADGKIAAGMYNAVLATYYQAGLMDYMNFFAVGNHDLIYKYATDENNQFIDFLNTNITENKNCLQDFPFVTGMSDDAEYYYDFYIGDDHYIVLSSPHDGNSYSEQQLLWVEDLLSADNTSGTRSIIINHEPMMNTGIYATSEYMEDAPALKQIIEDNSSNHKTVWFSGHTHVTYYDNVQNVSLEQSENVSYVGIPHIMNTGTRTKNISQGMQVKVYEDKVVMIGRLIFADGSFSTDILPSAIYVLDYSEQAAEPDVSITADKVENNAYPIGSTLTAGVSGDEATSYQWYVGGVAIDGATASTYTVTDDTPSGRLSVKVTTASGEYFGISEYFVVPNIIYVSSAAELMQIGKVDSMPLSGNYVLDADIDFSDTDFTPIGYHNGSTAPKASADIFTGTFDGGGHTISNITNLVSGQKYSYSALFGVIKDATVKNIVFKNCSFETYNNGTQSCAAAVAGVTVSTTTSPYSTTISNISVEDCTMKSTINNVSNPAGAAGLVGYSESGVVITDCYVDADITAILGGSSTSVSDRVCAAGFVAISYDGKVNVSNCLFIGTLDASDYSNGDFVSDIAKTRQNIVLAYNSRGGQSTPGKAKATNCYYADTVSTNTTNVLGLDATAKTADELKTLTALDLSLSSELWYKAENSVKLKISPDYSSANIKIYSANELSKIGKEGYPMDASYVLMNDIDLTDFDSDDNAENGNWTPIGGYTSYDLSVAFTGDFDGQGHKITGLTVIHNSQTVDNLYGGLFGVTYGTVKVENIVFEDCYIELHAKVIANAGFVAGRAQHNDVGGMTVNNIAVLNSEISIRSNNANNPSAAGSIVGQAHYVSISNCYSNAYIGGGCTAEGSKQFGLAGIIGQSWRAKVSVDNAVFVGKIDNSEHAGGGFEYKNGIYAMNLNQSDYATKAANFTDCYYNSTRLTVSSNTNGGEINGTALMSKELSQRSLEELGLDSEYWYHDGVNPVLKITGDKTYVLCDANGDNTVNIIDLIRMKKHSAQTATAVVYCCDPDGDGIITATDLAFIKEMLLSD